MSLRWSLSSLSHAEGLRDGTHPLAARTCDPRPLTQARQIRPAAPVGALKLGPADSSLAGQPERRRPIRRSDRTQARPYARITAKHRKQSRSTYPHPPCRVWMPTGSIGINDPRRAYFPFRAGPGALVTPAEPPGVTALARVRVGGVFDYNPRGSGAKKVNGRKRHITPASRTLRRSCSAP